MIARHHHAPTTLAKPCNRLAVRRHQPVAGVDREQPEFVKIRFVETGENRIGFA
jgi:hypothetical protein